MNQLESLCPVCGRQDADMTFIRSALAWTQTLEMQNRTHSADAKLITCKSCGEFVVTDQDYVNVKNGRAKGDWNPYHLSALLREQSIRPLPRYWLQDEMAPYGPLQRTDLAAIDLRELLEHWPRAVPERIDRALCNFARLSKRGGEQVRLGEAALSLLFAESESEAEFHLTALVENGILKAGGAQPLKWPVEVTPKGWKHFEEITRGASSPDNPVFVAMWFGGDTEIAAMDAAYHEAIQPAIEKAGYRATRVDLVEHNGWIMDKVLGDIRLAPFVVADFTGNRNGVYFEAGFARGIGIPVINSCRQVDFEKAHFDTKQLNHVFWTTPDELRERLYNRIMGTVGPGPHRHSEKK